MTSTLAESSEDYDLARRQTIDLQCITPAATDQNIRLAPPPAQETERPLWHTVAFLYAGIAVLIALEIVLAFVIAYLVTGRAV